MCNAGLGLLDIPAITCRYNISIFCSKYNTDINQRNYLSKYILNAIINMTRRQTSIVMVQNQAVWSFRSKNIFEKI